MNGIIFVNYIVVKKTLCFIQYMCEVRLWKEVTHNKATCVMCVGDREDQGEREKAGQIDRERETQKREWERQKGESRGRQTKCDRIERGGRERPVDQSCVG